jgi:lipid II:glycine glycyltransferase (peptidoglycan interpeptide bridge formation enzyme)
MKLGVGVDKKCPKVETYWMLYKETMTRSKGILDDSHINLFRLIWSRLKHGEDFITLTATFQNKPIGGIMAFLFKDKAYVWYNASLSRYLCLNPNEFLYWKLIEELTDKGYRYLDFGPTPLNPAEGHYLFKSRFGGTIIPFNDYAYFPSKIRYFMIEGGALWLAKKLNIRKKTPQTILQKVSGRMIF